MRILSAWGKMPRKRDNTLVTSVAAKHRTVLERYFSVVDRSEFAPAVVIQMPMEEQVFASYGLSL